MWLFRNRNAVLEGVASIHRFIEYVGPRKHEEMFKWVMTTSKILTSFQEDSYKEVSTSHWFPSSSPSSFDADSGRDSSGSVSSPSSSSSSSSTSSSSAYRHHLMGAYQLPNGVSGGLPAASSPSVSERNVILSLQPAKEVSVAFWNLCEGEVGLHVRE